MNSGLATLVAHIHQLGLTQDDVAVQIGVRQQSVSQWLRGERQPREAHQRALAVILGWSLIELQALTGWCSRKPRLRRKRGHPPASSIGPLTLSSRLDLMHQATEWLTARPPPHRLVTLIGPPGIGKTFLATQITSRIAETFGAHRVAMITFVAMPDSDPTTHLLREIITTLNLAADVAPPSIAQIVREINQQREPFLLVLDAFEWVLAARLVLGQLLARCPQLRILVTSTEVLLSGDQMLAVPPLAFPPLPRRLLRSHTSQTSLLRRVEGYLGPDVDWHRYEAVQFFIDQARAVRPDVRIDATTLPAIAVICQQLQGIPLLILLAAAGSRFTPDPRHLLADLGQFHRTLTNGGTLLQAAIGRFYARLPANDQALLRRLAILPGEFDLTTAATCILAISREEPEGGSITRGLAGVTRGILRLVDANLITATSREDTSYHLLDSIRTFALNELHETGEAASVMPAFAGWLLSLAQRGERTFGLAHGHAMLDQLAQLNESLRTILPWSLTEAPRDLGLPLIGALWWYWDTRALYAEGTVWLDQAYQRCLDDGIPIPGTIWYGRGVMAYRRGDAARAEADLTAAYAVFTATNDVFGQRWSLAYLGLTAEQQGDLSRAASLHAECTIQAQRAGDRFVEAGSLGNQAEIAIAMGRLDEAAMLIEQALTVAAKIESAVVRGRLWHAAGRLALRQGEVEQARQAFHEALSQADIIEDQRFIAIAVEGLATVAALTNEPRQALQLFATATVLREDAGSPRLAQHEMEFAQGMAAVRATIDAATWDALWASALRQATEALHTVIWLRGWTGNTRSFLDLVLANRS